MVRKTKSKVVRRLSSLSVSGDTRCLFEDYRFWGCGPPECGGSTFLPPTYTASQTRSVCFVVKATKIPNIAFFKFAFLWSVFNI
jgi:hypothetical protein